MLAINQRAEHNSTGAGFSLSTSVFFHANNHRFNAPSALPSSLPLLSLAGTVGQY
jgi:hypothetical protein